MEIVYRPLSELKPNPKNPRKSTPEAIAKLAESIRENPLFFEARPILLSDRTGELVIIGGERRSEAARLLGMKEVPTILLSGLTEEKEDEIMIRDNTHTGKWDEVKLKEIAKAWGDKNVLSWGQPGELVWKYDRDFVSPIHDDGTEIAPERFNDSIGKVVYEPKETHHAISDLYEWDKEKFDALLATIKDDALRKMLAIRAAWFCTFNFAKIADYYAYQATPQEQRVFEALGLVLLDKEQMIENGFTELLKDFDNENNHK